MASYKTFPEVLNAANAGKLTLPDWLEYEALVGSVNDGSSNYVTLDRANQLLAILKRTEPNDPVTLSIQNEITYGGPLAYRNDSKEVVPPKLPELKVPGLGSVTDFLNTLVQPNTWIRVAEFAIGALLVAIGVNALLKQGTGVDVAGTAKKTAKVVR